MLLFDSTGNQIYHGARRWAGWRDGWLSVETVPGGVVEIGPRQALAVVQAKAPNSGLPIGVIGPKAATPEQEACAERLGAAIAEMRVPVFCGGKSGVMEAACKGAKGRDGLTIGLLPDDEWGPANPYVDVPLASGIGPARNAIIARACPVLVAVGGEYGTLSEMAFGLHFNRTVIGLCGAPTVKGARMVDTVDDAAELAARSYLGIGDGDG